MRSHKPYALPLVLFAIGACGTTVVVEMGPSCTPGESSACTGPGGCSGTHVCGPDASYDPCACSPPGPQDAGDAAPEASSVEAGSDAPAVVDGSGAEGSSDGATDSGSSDVVSVEASTCPPPSGGVTALASGLTYPFGIAVSATAVFWTDPAANTVSKVSLADCSITTIASAQDNPVGVTVWGTHVYWTNGNGGGTSGAIMRAPQGGGTPSTLATGLYSPADLVTDGTNLYWAPNSNTTPSLEAVYQVALGGGTASSLVATTYCLGVAVHGSTVYWTDTTAGTVGAVPVGGGTPTELASAQSYPVGIAADSANLYWVDTGSNAVMTLPLGSDGGTPVTLATATSVAQAIVTDGVHVYFADYGPSGSIMRVPVGGGAVVTVVSFASDVVRLTVDATSVYWTGGVGGGVMRATPK